MGEAAVTLGRYTLHAELASGGMATVYIGRLNGPVGFGRTVAIKRLHPQFAKSIEFVTMFLDEARLAARIQHPNVVPTLDVVADGGELFLVLDFVRGESVAAIARAVAAKGERMPVPVAAGVVAGVLAGLAAAHGARDERGNELNIVHRDVSPQNILVGADGVTRLLDFGVAKARSRLSSTLGGSLKGKIAYMSPEQVRGDATQQSDVYAAGVVLWEMLAGRRLFTADSEVELLAVVSRGEVHPPSDHNPAVPAELDAICLRALARDTAERYPTARAMALDIDRQVAVASAMRTSEWMAEVAGDLLEARRRLVADVESGISAIGAPEALDALTQAVTPGAAGAARREAATKVIATVSSVAKAADHAVRDAAAKMANKAARDVVALADALKTPSSGTVLRRLGPLLARDPTGRSPSKRKKPVEDETPHDDAETRADIPTPSGKRPERD